MIRSILLPPFVHHLRCDLQRLSRVCLRRHQPCASTAATATATATVDDAGIGSTVATKSTIVPIVDLSLPIEDVGNDLHEACASVGFFHLVNHGVPDKLCADVLDQARQLFVGLTPQQKETFSVAHSNSYRGYQHIGVNITSQRQDGHEGFDIISESERAIRTNPTHPDGITNYGKNLWPDPIWMPSLQPTIERYVPEMNAVGMKLLQAASLGLGLHKDYFLPYFEDPYWSMRMIRYPPPLPSVVVDNDSTYEYGVGTHTDYGVFTMILCEDVKDTLQIRPKNTTSRTTTTANKQISDGHNDDDIDDDDEWITVDPIPGGFVCNIGDMLARWTNGIYCSTPHRVLRPSSMSGVDRVSVPFFFDPSYDALIHPIDELVKQSNRPPCFEPIIYGDHLLAKTSKNFQV
jgi:isopenicillin N synthase-like dioxygenase